MNEISITHLSPAHYIVHVIGGVRKTARALKMTPGAVCRWKRPISKNGCGGKLSNRSQLLILNYAKSEKLDITPADLIFGRSVKIASH